jgi:phage FluMu protein Com
MTEPMQEVHCPECGRMLFKVRGLALVETKCPKCKALVQWPRLDAVTMNVGTPESSPYTRRVEAAVAD